MIIFHYKWVMGEVESASVFIVVGLDYKAKMQSSGVFPSVAILLIFQNLLRAFLTFWIHGFHMLLDTDSSNCSHGALCP